MYRVWGWSMTLSSSRSQRMAAAAIEEMIRSGAKRTEENSQRANRVTRVKYYFARMLFLRVSQRNCFSSIIFLFSPANIADWRFASEEPTLESQDGLSVRTENCRLTSRRLQLTDCETQLVRNPFAHSSIFYCGPVLRIIGIDKIWIYISIKVCLFRVRFRCFAWRGVTRDGQ